jgi:hypothetical protein
MVERAFIISTPIYLKKLESGRKEQYGRETYEYFRIRAFVEKVSKDSARWSAFSCEGLSRSGGGASVHRLCFWSFFEGCR